VSALDAATVDGHRFVVDLPAYPVTAAADREKLRLVLANLLDNAVKFSPRGGQVTIVAREQNGAVEISVADEGIGIPPAAQELIFKKFYRGEGTPSRGNAGTGLGLFIVEGLVTAMHGRIWVTSAEGSGSSFTFELPAAEPTEAPATSHPDAERV
jgi:signal transduction histidine kinase